MRIDDPVVLLIPGLKQSLLRQNTRLIITRIDSEKLDDIHALEDMGFRVMDIQATYRREHNSLPNLSGIVHIRDAVPTDLQPFRNIAADAFENYGHYFADNRLDKARCRLIYPDWAESTLTGTPPADKIFVAESDGLVAGFLSFRLEEKQRQTHAVGIMGAVAREFRGKNVFSSIVSHALNWGKAEGLAWQEHNVLVANYPVNRVFSKLGFRQYRSFLTLHCWLDH